MKSDLQLKVDVYGLLKTQVSKDYQENCKVKLSNKSEKEKQEKKTRGAQIDLLIDRSDDVIDVCEMKYYAKEYAFTEEEYNKLQNRMLRLAEETKTRKAVQAILITTYGLIQNEYSDIVQSVVKMDDLF